MYKKTAEQISKNKRYKANMQKIRLCSYCNTLVNFGHNNMINIYENNN